MCIRCQDLASLQSYSGALLSTGVSIEKCVYMLDSFNFQAHVNIYCFYRVQNPSLVVESQKLTFFVCLR